LKKLPIITAFILIGFTSSSQENFPYWSPAVKGGVGIGLDYSGIIHVEIGAQIERKRSEIFSWAGNLDFARNFDTEYSDFSFNQISLSVGPRFYIKNSFFIGAGMGYIHSFEEEGGALLLNPYLGFDTRKIQYAVDFKTNLQLAFFNSFISFSVAYKFGGNQ
jgi:hypothetical protein